MCDERSINHRLCLAALLGVMCMPTTSCENGGRGTNDHIAPGRPIATVGPTGPFKVSIGYLTVYTKTRPYQNGDITYYPHQPYKLYDEAGELVQRVTNHRSNYDEKPTTVELPAGKYFVVPQGAGPGRPRIAVVIKGGEHTKVDVERLLGARGGR